MKPKTSCNTPYHYVSDIVTSAPSTAYAVPLPRVARGRLGLWHLSFPRHNGGSGEHSEPIGAFVQHPPFMSNFKFSIL